MTTEDADYAERRRTSFGAYAALYDEVRPSWPEPTMSWLTGDRPAGARVLDVGAGTGKGTRTLVAIGDEVTALDPSEGMLAQLRITVPTATVVLGQAESIPLSDSSFDAAVSLQAWHWVEHRVAGDEVARVLRPGGTLGLAWHAPDHRVAWVDEIDDAAGRQEDRSEQDWEAPEVGDRFDRVESAVFDYEFELSPEQLVRLVSSWSYVALAADRDQRLAAVREVADRIAVDGRISYPHQTHCYRYWLP